MKPTTEHIITAPRDGDSEGGETDMQAAAQKLADPESANLMLHEQLQAKDEELFAQTALVVHLRAELANARALADKVQHLLTSKTHECEGLRAQSCSGGCKPDLETVPLPDLIRHLALCLDDGQSLTIYRDECVSVQAIGKSFLCTPAEANSVLDASAMLAQREAA